MNSRRNAKVKHGIVAGTAAALALTGCQGAATGAGSQDFVIGYQQGLGSAVLMVVDESHCLTEAAPKTNVAFKQFNSGAAIRDSMLASEVQAGGVGLAPFLVGYAKGIDWKIVAPQNEMEFRLMVKDPAYSELADFEGTNAKIAVPAPDSIQSIVIRKAAQEQLGDAHALDTNMVAMSHPDAVQGLLSGQIAAHMASAPFSYLEEAEGADRILGSSQVFDVPINNTVVAVRDDVLAARPDVAAALTKCVEKAQDMLESDHGKAATYLASASGGKQSVQSIRADLAQEDLVWPTETNGIEPVATFMQELGLIDDVPPTPDVLYGG